MLTTILNKSCDLIMDVDIENVMTLIQSCLAVSYSHNGPMHAHCHQEYFSPECNQLPWQCVQYNAVHNIMYYFSDINFLNMDNNTALTYTTVFLPASEEYDKDRLKDFYMTKLLEPDIPTDLVELAGMELNIKLYIFNSYILDDLPLFGIAAGAVTFLLLVYMRSIVLMLAVILVAAFTVIVSYFLYFVVYR